MGRKPADALTPREAAIMDILWERGTATAEDIRAKLSEPLHDSTVRTVLRVLIQKGHVKRKDGDDGIVYRPSTPRHVAQKKAMGQLLRQFFGGRAEDLVLRMLDEEQITLEDLKRIGKQRKDQP